MIVILSFEFIFNIWYFTGCILCRTKLDGWMDGWIYIFTEYFYSFALVCTCFVSSFIVTESYCRSTWGAAVWKKDMFGCTVSRPTTLELVLTVSLWTVVKKCEIPLRP